MKSRSEVLREKRAKAESKTPAEERTVLLPVVPPGANAHCDACGEDSPAEKCSTRADGFAECPSCGAPVMLQARAAAPPPKETGEPAPTKAKAAAGPKNPERKYCGTCGSEWAIVNGQFFINCGHGKAERIEDPRKAEKYGPPAPLGVRVDAEKARRDAEDAAASTPAEVDVAKMREQDAKGRLRASGVTGPGAPILSGNRLSIPWGEARLPYDQFNGIKVGGHIVTVEVPEGADRIAVAEKIMDDLEEIADRLFRRQKAWYEKKLKILSDP